MQKIRAFNRMSPKNVGSFMRVSTVPQVFDFTIFDLKGVTFPAMHAMLSKWAPIYERSKLATLIYSGKLSGATDNNNNEYPLYRFTCSEYIFCYQARIC